MRRVPALIVFLSGLIAGCAGSQTPPTRLEPEPPATPVTAEPADPCAVHWRYARRVDDERWCEWADGTRDGPYHRAWPDGTPRVAGRYANGVRHGEWTAWKADGRVEWQGTFRNGERHGPWTLWGEYGAGAWPHFFAHDVDSHLVARGIYRDGRPDGRWTFRCRPPRRDPRGVHRELRCEGVYRGGRQIEWAVFHRDGRSERLILRDGGLTRLLRAPGHVRPDVMAYGGRPAEWIPGRETPWGADWSGWAGVVPHGAGVRYHPDGALRERGHWRRGQRHGVFEFRDGSGHGEVVLYRGGQQVSPAAGVAGVAGVARSPTGGRPSGGVRPGPTAPRRGSPISGGDESVRRP